MKKSKLIAALCALTISASAFGTVFTACNVSKPYVFEYEVSVFGGTGGGTYKDGDDCAVTAEIPEGKKFDKWVNEYGETLSNVNPYTFKVEGDTQVYAVVSDITTYRVEVVGGTVTGTSDYEAVVYEGEQVSVTATSTDSHKFVKWIINGTEESTANPYTFTATKDMKLEAVVDESYLVAVSGGTIGDGEETRKIFESGAECTITAGEAPASGMEFAYWYVLDENGDEKVLTFDRTYTFNVTGTDKYYAKFGVRRTVTVVGGIFTEYPDLTTITVLDGADVTVSLDAESIPAGKGFNGWKIDGEIVSRDQTFRLSGVSEDTTITADFVEKIALETPEMSANQMFRKRMAGGNENDYVLELDRGAAGTAFKENVECVMIYIYDSPFAGKDEWVGRMRVDNAGGVWQIATADGEKLWNVEGAPGNMWIESKDGFNQGKGCRGNAMDMIRRAIESCGNEYGENTPYYLAAQTVAKPYTLYADSEISQIGPQAFIQNDVAKYTVTIEGGTIEGTALSSVTVYEGQKITLVAENAQDFTYWLIGTEKVTENPYEITVTSDMTVRAMTGDLFTITLEGGTFEGGETQREVEVGAQCTITANDPEEGTRFAYWYTTGADGTEKVVSTQAEYTFAASGSYTYHAKFANVYTLTLTGGTVNGQSGEIEVLEGEKYTIALDLSAIPAGKGFTGWKIGEESETAYSFELTVTGDAAIEAVYADKVSEFTKPVNDANQMFKVLPNGIIEMDRKNKGVESEFDNPNVDHMLFYFYTFPFVDNTAENAAGYVKFQRVGESFRFVRADGSVLWTAKGRKSDLYHDNAGEAGYASLQDMLFALIKEAVGEENFNPDTPYYVAVQSCGKEGSIYNPSEISAIGPQAFILNNVAQYTVTIEGGRVEGTDLTSVTVYEGQKITLTADDTENFKFWLIGAQRVAENPYEITVTANTTVRAVTEDLFTLSVVGGTFEGGKTQEEAEAGAECTITADAPDAGMGFAYWYTLGENGEETVVSRQAEYTFKASASVTYRAKFVNVYTLTVTGGTVDGQSGKIEVLEGERYTIALDLSAIPAGKGFTGWKIGETVVNENEYTLTIEGDTLVEAQYADQIKLTAPEMSANQMLRKRMQGGNENDYCLELDRGSTGTAFKENVGYVKFYIYTSPTAAPSDYVGAFKLENVNGTYRLATMSGETLWNIEGGPGNMWLDSKDGYNSDHKGNFFKMMQTVLGDAFDANTPYYFAAQACTSAPAGSVYVDSDISEIGPQTFVQNNISQYTVKVANGTIAGMGVSEATIWEGQKITLAPADAENFGGWIINNSQKVTEAGYEFTVTGAMEIVGYSLGDTTGYTITVTGGTADGEGTKTVVIGNKATLSVSNAEEGKTYGWYKKDGENETFVCKGDNIDFYPTENTEFTVKELSKLTAPVNDANQMFDYESATCIILDRMKDENKHDLTAFTDNVDYVKFYVYTDMGGTDPVGYLVLNKSRLTLETKDGETLFTLKGNAGNLYLDGISKEAVRNAFKTALGDEVYESAEHLYVAAQACSNNPEYADSDISAVGSVDFKA